MSEVRMDEAPCWCGERGKVTKPSAQYSPMNGREYSVTHREDSKFSGETHDVVVVWDRKAKFTRKGDGYSFSWWNDVRPNLPTTVEGYMA